MASFNRIGGYTSPPNAEHFGFEFTGEYLDTRVWKLRTSVAKTP